MKRLSRDGQADSGQIVTLVTRAVFLWRSVDHVSNGDLIAWLELGLDLGNFLISLGLNRVQKCRESLRK